MCSSSLRKIIIVSSCKDINCTSASLPQGTVQHVAAKQERFISMQNFKMAVARNCTDAMKHSRVLDYVNIHRKLDFEEFCAASISVHQLESIPNWEEHARRGFELFEKDGNRVTKIEELASELGLSPSVPVHIAFQDWIRHSDGKLNFLGFIRLVRVVSA